MSASFWHIDFPLCLTGLVCRCIVLFKCENQSSKQTFFCFGCKLFKKTKPSAFRLEVISKLRFCRVFVTPLHEMGQLSRSDANAHVWMKQSFNAFLKFHRNSFLFSCCRCDAEYFEPWEGPL